MTENVPAKSEWVKARTTKQKHHALLGRKVNVVSCHMLYDYLMATMTRLAGEAYPGTSKEAHSWRLGCVERLSNRIYSRHCEVLRAADEAKAKATAERAARGDASEGALVLSDVFSTEEDLNNDAYWEYPAGRQRRGALNAKRDGRLKRPTPRLALNLRQ